MADGSSRIGDGIGVCIVGRGPAIVTAVVDALAPFWVDHVEMPSTSETAWRAVRNAEVGEVSPGAGPGSE